MDNKFLNRLSTYLLYFSILAFIIAFNLAHNPPGGWYQQFLPDLSGSAIVDITFTDSLTGYAVTDANSSSVSYIIKTSNGGDNWNVILSDTGRDFSRVQFVNNFTGYASTLYGTETAKLLKTTDKGNNWITLNNPGTFSEYQDISVVSDDELWMVFDNPFTGGVYRTTNSGVSWELMYPPQISENPDRIYMINSRIGFISNGYYSHSYTKRTTNAGLSWETLTANGGWDDIQFLDSLIGWKCRISSMNIIKTTNGGSNWENILTPVIGNPNLIVQYFSAINTNQIWGMYFGSYITLPNNSTRWVILTTTNNGLNWGYQLPDTSIRSLFDHIYFSDSLHGWTYSNRNNGVHTISGGDTITYPITDIYGNVSLIPDNFRLHQNYPNPFNPKTTIRYELFKSANVQLQVYDIRGREINVLVNKKQLPGEYSLEFIADGLASGVYLYSLFIDDILTDTKKMILLR